jgi:hypothetical protein
MTHSSSPPEAHEAAVRVERHGPAQLTWFNGTVKRNASVSAAQ